VLLVDRGEGKLIQSEERLIRPFTQRKLRDTLTRALDSMTPHIMRVGEVELDLVTREVCSPQGKSHLTPKQCHLLSIFMQRPNQVISRQDLMRQIWDTDFLGDTRTLDVHIRWLREKIEQNPTRPALLVTVRKVGYRLVANVPPAAHAEDEPIAMAED
jgi:DNA-binding response OmpR family regulator